MQYCKTKTTTSVAAAHAAETSVPAAAAPTKSRIMGVDAARGLALLGMLAVHVFPDFNDNGTPTIPWMVEHGKSLATFVLLVPLQTLWFVALGWIG